MALDNQAPNRYLEQVKGARRQTKGKSMEAKYNVKIIWTNRDGDKLDTTFKGTREQAYERYNELVEVFGRKPIMTFDGVLIRAAQ